MNTKNKNQSVIRGISAFFILLTHINPFVKEDNIFKAFIFFGYLWVAIFFFYSGFNLINSYIKNNDKLFKDFWIKKFYRIYLPFVISNMVFILVKRFLNAESFGKRQSLKYIFGINAINNRNWYIYAIIIFYFSAWLVLKVLSKIKPLANKKWPVLLSTLLIFFIYSVLYFNIAEALEITSHIRNVYPLTLLLGMIYPIYYDKINKALDKPLIYETLLLLSFFISVLLHYAFVNGYRFFIITPDASDYIVPITFTIMVMLISYKVSLRSKFFEFIDTISLETYIFHYVFLHLYNNDVISFSNSYIFLFIYLITTIIVSILIHKIINLLIKKTLAYN